MSSTNPDNGALSALDSAPVWLNSEPLTAAELRGRVVVVDVWTYSCVNWLRTLPYVRAWHERYRDRGLVVIGVHAPEFGFEHDLDNVRHAVGELEVGYPVVIDNDFTIWRSFDNHYWPALYLVDGDGRVRFHHFGEGAYEEIELAIQQLLGVDEEIADVEAVGIAAAADWDTLRSPETYLGGARGERRVEHPTALNQWALTGEWSVGTEAAVLDTAGGSIAYRFESRDVNLVLSRRRPGPLHRAPRRPAARRCGAASTSTSPAKGRFPSRGCTSSFASEALSASGRSRSRSTARACARTCSRSGDSASGRRGPHGSSWAHETGVTAGIEEAGSTARSRSTTIRRETRTIDRSSWRIKGGAPPNSRRAGQRRYTPSRR